MKTQIKTSKKTKKNQSQPVQIKVNSGHPSHEIHLPRLSRVKGQIDGIERMVKVGRYCPDIIVQLKAAASALKAIEAEILKSHLRGCVKKAFSSDGAFESEQKIQEIVKLIY